MATRGIFKRFLSAVMKDMEGSIADFDFQWRKHGVAGAEGVARYLKEQNKLEEKPPVTGGGGEKTEPISVNHGKYRHEFLVESSRYMYTRLNGKPRYMFKDFNALRNDFWKMSTKKESRARRVEMSKGTKNTGKPDPKK